MRHPKDPVTLPVAFPDPPQPTKSEKKTRIPKRIAEVVNLLISGECQTVKAAAERVGFHPNYLYTALKKPEIQVFYGQRVRETIGAGQMIAAARLMQLIHANSEHVSADVSMHTLAIAGIKPVADAQVNINIEAKAGFVIRLTDPDARSSPTSGTDAKVINGLANETG